VTISGLGRIGQTAMDGKSDERIVQGGDGGQGHVTDALDHSFVVLLEQDCLGSGSWSGKLTGAAADGGPLARISQTMKFIEAANQRN